MNCAICIYRNLLRKTSFHFGWGWNGWMSFERPWEELGGAWRSDGKPGWVWRRLEEVGGATGTYPMSFFDANTLPWRRLTCLSSGVCRVICLSPGVCHLVFVVWCLSSGVCCLVFVMCPVCHLVFVVWCLSSDVHRLTSLSSGRGAVALVDISERCQADPDSALTAADLAAWRAEHGPFLSPTVVLVRTGNAAHWTDTSRYWGFPADYQPDDTAEFGTVQAPPMRFPGESSRRVAWCDVTLSSTRPCTLYHSWRTLKGSVSIAEGASESHRTNSAHRTT